MIAIPEIGHFALILAFVTSVALAGQALLGAQRGWAAGMAITGPASGALALFVSIAFGCLAWSFFSNDFSLRIVADNSNTQLPAHYRVAATWGSHEGSLLLWTLLLSWWTLAVQGLSGGSSEDMRARAVGVMAAVAAGFLALLVFASNPFVRLFPTPLEGRDLNPLLQDPSMVLHPPLLYMGYVGFSVVFAFAIAALIEGRVDEAWARRLRPWTTTAWALLTLGIVLGSRWAYYELGWGGWWFWDPVENASLMPWLAGTALVHSLAVTDTRGELKKWTLLLAIVVFSLSLLGTFLVRSGVLTSVHAFAIDPLRGVFILAFLGVVVGGSLLLFAFRAASIAPGPGFAPLSRETLLLTNTLLFSVAAGCVLLGTLYPLAMDTLGLGKISVGPPYFNTVFVPLMVPLLFLAGIGPLARWKRAAFPELARRLKWAAVAAGIAAAVLPLLSGEWRPGPALGLGLAAWIAAATLTGLIGAARSQAGWAWPAMHRFGMALAHFGLAVFVAGVTVVSAYQIHRELRLAPGESVTLGEYRFHFDDAVTAFGPNYVSTRATVDVMRDGRRVARLFPEKRRYNASGIVLTEAAIHVGLFDDLYVSLGERLDGRAWSLRIYVKPLVEWIFAGFALMAAGGFLAASGRRTRRVSAAKLAAGAAFGIPMFRARRGDRAAGNGVYQSIAVPLAVVLAAVLLYARFGSPHLLTPISTEALLRAGAPDDAALERLKTHLARNRDDARGWVLAARAYAAREQLKEAAGAYARAIAASAKVGQDAEVLSEYADILGAIAGTLKGRPERLLTEALALNPRHRKAMELAGSAALERNDYAAAIVRWEALAAELPAGDPLAPRLAGAIEKARERAQRSRIYGDVIDAP